MKTLCITLFVLLASQLSYGQQVKISKLEINKGFPVIENYIYFSMEFVVFADMSHFTYKLDATKSKFTTLKDDTGFDLLKAQREYEKNASYPEKIEFRYYRPIENSEKPGFKVEVRVKALPSAGSKLVKAEGVIAMVNAGEGEKLVEVKSLPTNWNSNGVETELGIIKLSESGSASIGEVTFTKYRVVCDQPVASITIAGGDDSTEAREKYNIGIEADEIVFKKIPESLDLTITVTNTEIVEIPFALDISIGF